MAEKKEGAVVTAIEKIGEMVEKSVKIDVVIEDREDVQQVKREVKVLENQEDEIALVDTQPTSPQEKEKEV